MAGTMAGVEARARSQGSDMITCAELAESTFFCTFFPQKGFGLFSYNTMLLSVVDFCIVLSVPSEAAYDLCEHLKVSGISVDSVANSKLLKSLEHDRFHQGVEIFVGKTNNMLFPVSAVLAHLANRGSKKEIIFQFEDGRLLTQDRFMTTVREALRTAGVYFKAYTGHSFRIGAATSLAGTSNYTDLG